MALACGTRLGPYEVQSAIGAGGMGEVYRARDTRLDRTVAVKILPAHLSADSAARQRFDREARVISSLNHPNICHLYDVGRQDGVDFIVMELLEGETLADRLKKGPLPLEQVLKCGIEICEGLEKAHRSGVVHRDLKPGNVMLTKSGAKLMDFGVAKAMEAVKTATATATIGMAGDGPPLTAQGTVVGTFQYMAPEQLEGKEADARADIFALGAVLYEMATGKCAFGGKTTASVIAAVLERDPPPVSATQPASPPALDALVRGCLAKDPDERFQSIHDLKLELRWMAEAGSHAGASASAAPSAKSKIRNRLLTAVALMLAVVGGALGHAYLRGGKDDPPEVRSSILPPENESFLIGGFALAGFALSHDGSRLAFFSQSVEGKMGLWVRALNSTAAQEVAANETGAFPFWSPDGQWIAFFSEGKLKRVPSSGGPVQVICDAVAGRGGAWNSRGVIVFAPSTLGPLYRVPASGGAPVPVTKLDTSLGETTHRWPDFLPDGGHFLYLARQPSDTQPASIFVGSLDSPSRKKVLDSLTEAHYSAPGYLLFARKTTLFAQRFDARASNLTGEPAPIVQDANMPLAVLRSGFTVSQAGNLTYASSNAAADVELIVTDRSGRRLSSLETPGYVRLSPDGLKVAVLEPTTGGSEPGGIWIYDLNKRVPSKFTFGGRNDNPIWSPDGSQLAFGSDRTGTFNLYVKPATGGAEEQPLHATTDEERPQSWSPDGRYIVIDSRPQSRLGLPQIAILPMMGDRKPFPYLNSAHINSGGQVSPDGRWLAYGSNETGRMEVYVSSFPQAKGRWQVSFTGGQFPGWQKDGRELFYCRTDGALMVAEVTPGRDSFAVGSATQVTERRIVQGSLFDAPYDVFPDGQRLIMPAVKSQSIHPPLTLITNWTAGLKK
jgi:serine/threonine protein kinase/Tol biopolymer transport system component